MKQVSIIIPTHNSARTLEQCLLSVKDQDYGDIEIIVVDNFSTDTSFEITQKYTEKVFQIWPERTAQKNYGIEQARGEYLCFIDSDMTLEKKVISECVKQIENSETVGWVCIPERSVWDWFFVKVRDFERSFYKGTAVESARFFRKYDVGRVWGFEEDLIFFEESLLPQKIESFLELDCKARISEYIEHNESDIKLFSWLKKKYYYGKSLQEYTKKVKDIGIKETWDWQIGIIWRYMIFLKNSRFYGRPFLAISVLCLKTLEFWAGWFGLLVNKIKK